MPVSTTAPCPIEGCDGRVDVEVKFKVELPAEAGCKPGRLMNISTDVITLVGDHMSERHPDVEIPARLRGAS